MVEKKAGQGSGIDRGRGDKQSDNNCHPIAFIQFPIDDIFNSDRRGFILAPHPKTSVRRLITIGVHKATS